MKVLVWAAYAAYTYIAWRLFREVSHAAGLTFAAAGLVVIIASLRRHIRLIRAGKRPRT